MIQDVLEFARRNMDEGRKVALITVTNTSGSSPASVGQMMAVLADGTACGTIGGGASEHSVVKEAVKAIGSGALVFEFSIDHAEKGMVCGGSMSGFGSILGSGSELVIFGGGHIAQSLAPLARSAGFGVTVVEDRAELAAAFSGVRFIVCGLEDYGRQVRLTDTSYAVICTRGHKTDDDALRFCLKSPAKYLGMIGSTTKVTALFDRLRSEGAGEGALERVYAPIGLDVADSAPFEIAVSIMAEILLVKNNGSPRHKKLRRR